MLTRSRRLQSLVLGLTLLAALPDLRWCRLAWADVPAECWSDLPVACAAPAASCASPSACDAPAAPSACATDDAGEACGRSCEAPASPWDRAWCPSDALGAYGVACTGLEDDPAPAARANAGEPDVPAEPESRGPPEAHPPPPSADPGALPPIRGPPLTPLRLV